MARTVDVIKNQIYDQIALQPKLAGIVGNPSQMAHWKLFIHTIAVCIAVFEQIIDVFKSDNEATIAKAPVGSEPWLYQKIKEFQYDAITPQILTLVDFSPVYNPVDTTKRIITRVSVKTTPYNTVLVKVAKSEPPVALSGPELSALQSYLTDGGDGTYAGRGRGLGFAGIKLLASSITADKLFLKGTIYYNGQYASTISASVIAAINIYLANLPFDGSISLLGITDAIQNVVGVNDVLLEDVAIRADATVFASKTFLVQAKTTIFTTYPTFAGYVVEETQTGEDFATRLTFTAS